MKPEKQPLVRQDMNIFVPAQTLPVELIMDGQIIQQNLRQKHLTEAWLIGELTRRGINDLSQVTFACIGSDQKFYIDVKKDSNTQAFNISD